VAASRTILVHRVPDRFCGEHGTVCRSLTPAGVHVRVALPLSRIVNHVIRIYFLLMRCESQCLVRWVLYGGVSCGWFTDGG